MKYLFIITLAVAIASPCLYAQPAMPPLLKGKPHAAVLGVVKGVSSEYLSVGDTNSIPVYRGGKKNDMQILRYNRIPRLTYVRGVPNWRSYKAGDTLKLDARDCYVINASDNVRTVQYWKP